jgi:peroxiredoxin
MQQIVDLHGDAGFQALDVGLVSIAFDSPNELATGAAQYGIAGVPLTTDSEKKASEAYDVLKWAVGTGEPGHTFVLVDEDGKVAWIRDYGAPENGGVMYVPPRDLTQQIAASLGR